MGGIPLPFIAWIIYRMVRRQEAIRNQQKATSMNNRTERPGYTP